MLIANNTNTTLFFDTKNQDLITGYKSTDLSVQSIAYLSHEKNSCNYIYRPDEYLEVVGNIVPIPSKTKWNFTHNNFHLNSTGTLFKKRIVDKSFLLKQIERYIHILKKKKIAVQISGGLDSSIIIGILHHFNIHPFLIGFQSDRYEFRTERIIQNIIVSRNNNDAVFINSENYLPFSELRKVPKHYIPNASSLFYNSELAMAEKCKEKGIEILFNGMGLDSIFCLETIETNKKHWYPWAFDNKWFSDHLYNPLGVYFNSGAYSDELVNIIWNLRYGMNEDNNKLWARNFFKEFIPKELVDYTYKADHAGLLIDGIYDALTELKIIFGNAFKYTRNETFSESNFESLFHNFHLNNDSQIKAILASSSFAVWLNRLI